EAKADLDRELRGDLIRTLGVLGDDPETQAAAREAETESRNGVDVEPSVAAAAVDVVAFVGGPEDYEGFRMRAKDAPTPQEHDRYLYALTRFRDEALFERTLNATSSQDVRAQDAPFVLARAQFNRELGSIAWRFVRDNWDDILGRIAPSNVIALSAGIRTLTDPEVVADVQAFFAEHVVPHTHRPQNPHDAPAGAREAAGLPRPPRPRDGRPGRAVRRLISARVVG